MKFRNELWLLVIALVLVASVLAPPARAAGQRIVVRVDEPFEVGGQVFPDGGKLSLREVGSYSPVATLNEIRVNGRSLGVVIARNDDGKGVSERNELIFERSEHGHLVLASLAFKNQPVRRLQPVGGPEDSSPTARLPRQGSTLLASTD